MLFVTLCKAKPGVSETAMRRRLDWQPPKGVKILAEFWLPNNNPRVILATDAPDPATIFVGAAGWDDLYDMETFPAVTGEQGLEMARALLAQRDAIEPARVPVGV